MKTIEDFTCAIGMLVAKSKGDLTFVLPTDHMAREAYDYSVYMLKHDSNERISHLIIVDDVRIRFLSQDAKVKYVLGAVIFISEDWGFSVK